MGAQCCEPGSDYRPTNDENPDSLMFNSQQLRDERIVVEYFEGVWGRAYPLLLLLEYHGVDFKYVEVSQEEWAERKKQGTAGEMAMLPIVTSKGQQMQQFCAIMRAIGSEHGYYSQ